MNLIKKPSGSESLMLLSLATGMLAYQRGFATA